MYNIDISVIEVTVTVLSSLSQWMWVIKIKTFHSLNSVEQAFASLVI
jgi:hypothetical protein